jgi:hypothetical protein
MTRYFVLRIVPCCLPNRRCIRSSPGVLAACTRVVLAFLAMKCSRRRCHRCRPWGGSSSVKPRLQSMSRPKCSSDNVHELRKHVVVLRPLTVLREAGRVPDRIVRRQSHEPAVQAIAVPLLDQLSFRPNAVERLHSNCSGEIDGSNRACQSYDSARPAHHRQAFESSRRMVRRHQRLGEMYENSRP